MWDTLRGLRPIRITLNIQPMMNEPSTWCLEGYVDDNREIWRTMVNRLPFQVGRAADSDLVLPFSRVSSKHAKLFLRQSSLWLRDLGSTNGTFVNGKKVTEDSLLNDGDIVHFADHEFRLVTFSTQQIPSATQTLRLDDFHLPSQNFHRGRDLRQMLENNAVRVVFQPLVGLADEKIMGYEVLGRGELSGEETPVTDLFYLAEAQGLEKQLSTAFRDKGVDQAVHLPEDPTIFVNTHPSELADEKDLLASLSRLRERHPARSLVLEIHESAVADLSALHRLRDELDKLDIGIAFDDFGVGQSRFLELTDFSPQFVKFDRSYVKDLHRATRQRSEIIETLKNMVTRLDIATIAEGVECREEADACRRFGFQYAQGYFFGRPSRATIRG